MIEKLNEALKQLEKTVEFKIKKQIKLKVFLGGTTAKTKWRDELIPKLNIDYFNPIVEDWTEECIKIENEEKENKCGIHLYVITPKMMGVYSIAEAVQSSHTDNKLTIFCILDKDGFSEAQLKSLKATSDMLENNGVKICNSLDEISEFINNISKNMKLNEEKSQYKDMFSSYIKKIKELEDVKDNAYSERNKLVKFLTMLYPSCLGKHEESDTSWDKDWMNIIFLETPEGQLSWHIHDSELPMFKHLKYNKDIKWDGHTTEEKYKRLEKLGKEVK
jgi:hypothetical protein